LQHCIGKNKAACALSGRTATPQQVNGPWLAVTDPYDHAFFPLGFNPRKPFLYLLFAFEPKQ
jgi:hypothetical protein